MQKLTLVKAYTKVKKEALSRDAHFVDYLLDEFGRQTIELSKDVDDADRLAGNVLVRRIRIKDLYVNFQNFKC